MSDYQIASRDFESDRNEDILRLQSEYLKNEENINNYKVNIDELVVKVLHLENEVKRLKEQKSKSVCSKCKQDLPFKDDDTLSDYENDKYDYFKKKSNLELMLKYAEEKQDSILAKVIEAQESVNSYDKTIISVEMKIHKAEQELHDLKTELLKLELARQIIEFWVIGFGPIGIKSLLFDSIIPSINYHLDYFLKILSDGMIQVMLKPDKELKSGALRNKFSVIINNVDGGKTYEDCSEGEKRQINLGFLFAIQAVSRERLKSAINIAVLDEALDTIDNDIVEAVFEILRELSKDRSVFIISHSDNLKALFDNEYKVIKQHGVSKLITT